MGKRDVKASSQRKPTRQSNDADDEDIDSDEAGEVNTPVHPKTKLSKFKQAMTKSSATSKKAQTVTPKATVAETKAASTAKAALRSVLAEEKAFDHEDSERDDISEDGDSEIPATALGEGDNNMLQLANRLDKVSSSQKLPRRRILQGAGLKENSFATKVTTKLSLADLMSEDQEIEGQGQLKKRLERLQGSRTAQIIPALSSVEQQRADRIVGYEEVSSRLDAWEPVVASNRRQKLSFPLNEISTKEKPSIQNVLPKKDEPRTDAEKEILEALRASGLASESQVKEEEERQLRDLDPEEAKQRTAELAKMRALMFYSEQKAKRIKKIKSKTFRKLRKKRLSREEEKALESLRESDPEAFQAHEEKIAKERAMERMSLRHKNTSKNMRELSKRHKFESEQEEKDELSKRMRGAESDSDEDDTGDSDDSQSGAAGMAKRHLDDVAHEVAQSKEQLKNAKGLFALKFMQRGAEKEHDQALEEAEDLVNSLEDPSGKNRKNAQMLTLGRRTFDTATVQHQQVVKPPSKPLFENAGFSDDDEEARDSVEPTPVVRKSSRFNGTSTDPLSNKKEKAPATGFIGVSQISSSKTLAGENRTEEKVSQTSKEAHLEDKDEDNPWLAPPASSSRETIKKSKNVADQVVSVRSVLAKVDLDEEELDEDELERRKEQKELVKRAFADVFQTDFEAEQRKLAEEEAEKAEKAAGKNIKVAGWGSWAGIGVKEKKTKSKLDEEAKALIRVTGEFKPVIVSKRTNKLQKKYQVDAVPYPFTSREQYERSLTDAVGPEWNTYKQYEKKIVPDVTVKVGTIVEPLRVSQKTLDKAIATNKKKRQMPSRRNL